MQIYKWKIVLIFQLQYKQQIREDNGNPLQYSCLENPMDGGAWWAAVYGVAQSQTRLKRLKQQQQQQRTRILERELAFQKVN